MADGPAAPGAGVPGCYVLTIYGLVPTCTLSPSQQDELADRAATYLTDGARATAAPTTGPGAAYFHDGARVLAAPTTSWVQTTDPELGAGTFGGGAPAPAPRSSSSRATLSPLSPAREEPTAQPSAPQVPAPAPAPASIAGASAPRFAATTEVPDANEAVPEAPLNPTSEGAPLGPTTEVIPSGALGPIAGREPQRIRPSAASPSMNVDLSPSAIGLGSSTLWLAIGTSMGALIVFVAVRALALRLRRP